MPLKLQILDGIISTFSLVFLVRQRENRGYPGTNMAVLHGLFCSIINRLIMHGRRVENFMLKIMMKMTFRLNDFRDFSYIFRDLFAWGPLIFYYAYVIRSKEQLRPFGFIIVFSHKCPPVISRNESFASKSIFKKYCIEACKVIFTFVIWLVFLIFCSY